MLNIITAALASCVVMAISTWVGIYLLRYRSGTTAMLGMMVGMTLGMMTGIAVGYFAGAASDMFISNIVGVIIGLIFGVVFGRVGGLMGMMDGGMGGMMGGMMGAMLGVMLQYLYDGWAVTLTSVLIGVIYLASMVALVVLVRRAVAAPLVCDPVCNMKVDPKCSVKHTFQDQTYYFCCPTCQRSFAKDPGAYLNK